MLHTIRLKIAAASAAAVLTLTAGGAAAGADHSAGPVGQGNVTSYALSSYTAERTPAASGTAVPDARKVKAGTSRAAASVAYKATTNVNLRKGAGTKHAVVRMLAKGTAVAATGRKSGVWLQVRAGNATGWINGGYLAKVATKPTAAAKPAPKPAAKPAAKSAPKPAAKPAPKPAVSMWTKVSTGLYGNAVYGKKLLNLNAQVQVTRVSTSGTMTKVKYGNTIGWVTSDFLSPGRPGTTAKPYPKASTYAQHAANNIAKWCWGVPVKTHRGSGGMATFSSSSYGGDEMTVSEEIEVGTDDPVNSDPSKATQYHECAHILQYRAYKYDDAAMSKAMNRIYPRGGANTYWKGFSHYDGAEHMADCMADVMGAKRTGKYTKQGLTYTWWSGYGGNCTSAQLNAAKKIIAGQRI